MINKEERLSEHGYQFMLGNLYSSHFPRYNQRKQNKALLGGEVSTWTSCNEERYAFEGKMYEFLYTSNMLWNKGYEENMRLTYCEIVNKEIEKIREYIRYGELKSYRKKEIPFEKNSKDVPFDIRDDFEAAVSAGAGESKEITVGLHADRITFLHALSLPRKIFPFADPEKLGEYVIAYTDGTKEIEEVLYGVNIYEYQRRYAKPLDSMHYRHQGYPATYYCRPVTGKTALGKAYTLYEHYWGNPHPEKEIASITLRSKEIDDNHILLFDVSVLQK